MLFASNLDHAFVDHSFITGVHALVDLIDNTEWSSCHGLKRHKIEDCGNRAFATRLSMLVQKLKRLIFSVVCINMRYEKKRGFLPEFDLDLNCPLIKVVILMHTNLTGATNLLKVV
jgi:hypothetical protein